MIVLRDPVFLSCAPHRPCDQGHPVLFSAARHVHHNTTVPNAPWYKNIALRRTSDVGGSHRATVDVSRSMRMFVHCMQMQ